MSVYIVRGVDGWVYAADPSTPATGASTNAGPGSGQKLVFPAQTGNTVAGNVANQALGSYALPALAGLAQGPLTISNTLIVATSIVAVLSIGYGTTTPAVGALGSMDITVHPPTTGSVVLDVRNLSTTATLSTDYLVWLLILN